MIRHLSLINLIFLLLIGGLCIFQWHVEKEARQRINSLQRTLAGQEQKIAEQDESITGANEDLDRFRVQVTELKTQNDSQIVQIREEKAQVFKLEETKAQLTKQVEGLHQALETYKAAVASRDDNIKTLLEQREQLIGANRGAVEKANLAVTTYNELNTRYSDLVARYNELAVRAQAAAASQKEAATKPAQ
jgi:chromosome segregation ATPase